MKKIFNEKNLNILIFVFLIMQPFLEIYWLYHFEGISGTFTLSPSTILRLLWFGLVFLLFIFDKKKFKHIILMSVLFFSFAFLHHLFSSNTSWYKSDTYSFINEMFYLVKLSIPLYLIYILSKYKIDDSKFEKALFIMMYIFGIAMVVTNLFMIALPAYPYSEEIAGNFFNWFTARANDLTFESLATKGIFNQANQMSGFVILMFPIMMYYFYKKFSVIKLIGIIITIISMYMMGTRVLAWGLLMVLGIMLGIYIFLFIINKKNLDKKIVIVNVGLILFSVILYFFSPLALRRVDIVPKGTNIDYLQVLNKQHLDKFCKFPGPTNEDISQMVYFIRTNSTGLSVPLEFINIYEPEKDAYFWLNYFTTEYKERGNYRNIQTAIWNRMHEQYGNVRTDLFGFSYTATYENGMSLERDIIAQKNFLGYIGGLIFIGPFILIVIYAIYRVLRFRNLFNFENLVYILSLGLTLCVSVFSGNMLDIFVVTIPFAILSSILIRNLN